MTILLRAGLLAAALCAQALPAAQAPAGAVDGLLLLPPFVSPGEELELAVLDPVLTPPGGRWEIGGAAAVEDAGRLRVRLPTTLTPGQDLSITYRDPAGNLRVAARAAAARVVAAGTAGAEARIVDSGGSAAAGEVVCVCGSFTPASWDGLTLDGRPLRDRVSASGRVVMVRLPADLPAGPHVIAGAASAGFPLRDAVLVRALRVAPRLERGEVLRGQSAAVQLTLEGTEDIMALRLTNATPDVVSLEGGAAQEAPTSGGERNQVRRMVRGLRKGRFRLGYELMPPPCPCEPAARTARVPFLPGRLLALVPGTAEALPAAARALAATHALVVLEAHPLPSIGEGLVVFGVPADADVPRAAATLRRDPRVTLAQPDFVHETVARQGGPQPGNDYARRLIGADRLPPQANGAGVTVALVDTGVDADHRALKGAISAQVDLTGRGLTPDVHGTLMAGILAGRAGGVEGVAPRAALLVVKACHPESPRAINAVCTSVWLARGLDAALQRDARVLSLSVAGRPDEVVARLVAQAVRSGRVVVAAAGHEGGGSPPHPAALDGVLAATAVDAGGALYPPATRGSFVDLAAPGVDVLSSVPGNQVAFFSGTSAAAAYVAGAVALLLQRGPRESPSAVAHAFERTARDLGPPGRDDQFGSGLLDVCRAVRTDHEACR